MYMKQAPGSAAETEDEVGRHKMRIFGHDNEMMKQAAEPEGDKDPGGLGFRSGREKHPHTDTAEESGPRLH
jgi:hypothetical protein